MQTSLGMVLTGSKRTKASSTTYWPFALYGHHGVKQLVKRPNVAGDPAIIAAVEPQLAALARLSSLPAEIVIGREHGESRFQVAQLLGEAVGQPVEPLHKQPLRAVQPLDVAGAYRADFPAGLCSAVPVALRADHFARRVDHLRVAVFLDDRAELHVGAERQVNRFGVGREAVGRDLRDRLVAAGL